jgi:hypothetical protein
MRDAVLAELNVETDVDGLGRLTQRLGTLNRRIDPDVKRSAALERIRKEHNRSFLDHGRNILTGSFC